MDLKKINEQLKPKPKPFLETACQPAGGKNGSKKNK